MVEEVGGRRVLKGTSSPRENFFFLSLTHSFSLLQAGLKLFSTCLQVVSSLSAFSYIPSVCTL